MCLAEFERVEQNSLKESWGNRRRGDNNLPRDTYHVLTTCLLSVLLGCHKDDTHKSRPNTGAWFKGEKESVYLNETLVPLRRLMVTQSLSFHIL